MPYIRILVLHAYIKWTRKKYRKELTTREDVKDL